MAILNDLSSIVANTTSLKHRPMYQSISGGVECTALAVGPLLSGTIAHYSSWRIAFYINIAICVANALAVFFFVHDIQQPEKADLNPREKFQQLDSIGFFFFVPMTVCLILSLQWGGTVYDWNNPRIIALLTLAGILALAFLYSQYRAGENGMFPLQLMRQRSVALGAIFTFCMSACLFVSEYYVSELSTDPGLLLTMCKASDIFPGSSRSQPVKIRIDVPAFRHCICYRRYDCRFCYYTPRLLYTGHGHRIYSCSNRCRSRHDIPNRHTSCRNGLYTRCCLERVQVWLFSSPISPCRLYCQKSKVATGLVVLSFTQDLGGIIALAISQNVFEHHLYTNAAEAVPGFDPTSILRNGITDLRNAVPSQFLGAFLIAYDKTLTEVFYIAVAFGCLTMIGAIGIEWKSVKEDKSTEGSTATVQPVPLDAGHH